MIEDESGAKEHLHVLVITPTDRNEVITVPICTRQRWSETLVCLEVGDHPFIQHASFVAFRHARIRSTKRIEEAIASGLARRMEAISPAVLERIHKALPDSDFVPNEVRAFFKDIMKI